MFKIYLDSDNEVSLGPLVNTTTDTAITDADVYYYIKDLSDNVVVDITEMDHLADGIYYGIIDDNAPLAPANYYWLVIVADKNGSKLTKVIESIAVYDNE